MHRSLFLLFAICLWVIVPAESFRFSSRKNRYQTFAPYAPTTASTSPPTSAPAPTPFPSCTREFSLFDFITATPPEEVKQRLAPANPLYLFKEKGTCRYILVVENTQGEDNLDLPADAKFNVVTFPIELLTQFAARFTTAVIPNRLIELPEDNLIFLKVTWCAEGLNEDEYRALAERQAQNVLAMMDLENRVNFVRLTGLPTTFLFFWSRTDCIAAEDIFNNLDAQGGPGCVKSEATRIVKI